MMKRSLGAEEWIRAWTRRGGADRCARDRLRWDRGVLTRVSLASTGDVEQKLLDRLHPASYKSTASNVTSEGGPVALSDEGSMPSLDGAVSWLNSPPLTTAQLRGKVVLVDFWTYSCINCLRSIPYIEAWAEKYKSDGLVVIGVHTPEFAFEKDPANVAKAVQI